MEIDFKLFFIFLKKGLHFSLFFDIIAKLFDLKHITICFMRD